MFTVASIVFLLLPGLQETHSVSKASAPADLIIENARIWTDGRDGVDQFAAVRDGRFIHVGPKNDSLIGPGTQRIDAEGRVVLPGLIDSHIHMINGGTQLSQLQLREAKDRDDFIKRVAEWAATRESGQWILGGRWSVESWSDQTPPIKQWIDPVTKEIPVFLTRMDGHSALVNSAALTIAGITADGPPDPVGGVIDRDPVTREPTGILRESAMAIVSRHIPADTIKDDLHALKLAMREALRHGITAVCDIPNISDLHIYEQLLQTSNELKMRLFLYPTASDWNAAADRAKRFNGRPMWLEVRGFKTYIDGSLGSRTAYMVEPYLNNEPEREGWRGLLREGVADGGLQRTIDAARSNGLQAIAHAIGDQANSMLLDACQAVYHGELFDARCRSEHAQHLRASDIPRFARLGVIASMQPYHKSDDGRYAENYIGAERCRSSYAFKSLLEAGAVVAFGSDWPVVTLNPFLGIEAAVTGRTLDGKAWQTQENISVKEALRCYTSRAAFAMFAEKELGRIEPGYRADFIVLNHSPFVEDVNWSEIKPVAVYVEGQLVNIK